MLIVVIVGLLIVLTLSLNRWRFVMNPVVGVDMSRLRRPVGWLIYNHPVGVEWSQIHFLHSLVLRISCCCWTVDVEVVGVDYSRLVVMVMMMLERLT